MPSLSSLCKEVKDALKEKRAVEQRLLQAERERTQLEEMNRALQYGN